MSLQNFFSMGGYARYVWPAYAALLTVLGLNLISTRVLKKKVIQRLTHYYRNSDESTS